VVGVVYAKDILLKPAVSNLTELMRPPWFVTENMKIQTLLNQFKSKKTQIAIVVDEYGGTSGLITIEDIMEELVGEIQDEYDSEEIPSFNRIDENVVIVNGMYSIRDLNTELNINIDPSSYDNVADYLLEHFNHVPKINEKLRLEGDIEFTILDSNKKRINRVRVERVKETPEDDD
jgi:CBS domain containing-hemolysin-like protein